MTEQDFKDIRKSIIGSAKYAWIGCSLSIRRHKRLCRSISCREYFKSKAEWFIFIEDDKWYKCDFNEIKKRIAFQTPSKKWCNAPVNNYGLIEQSYLLNHCDEIDIEDIYVNEL